MPVSGYSDRRFKPRLHQYVVSLRVTLVSVHECLIDNEIDNHNSNCEVIWAEVQTQGKPTTTGAFNRPPSAKESSLRDVACSKQGTKNRQNKHIVVCEDINLPHINWKKKSIKAGSNHQIQHQQFLDTAQEHGHEHIQLDPSMESNVLHMYLTTFLRLFKS